MVVVPAAVFWVIVAPVYQPVLGLWLMSIGSLPTYRLVGFQLMVVLYVLPDTSVQPVMSAKPLMIARSPGTPMSVMLVLVMLTVSRYVPPFSTMPSPLTAAVRAAAIVL